MSPILWLEKNIQINLRRRVAFPVKSMFELNHQSFVLGGPFEPRASLHPPARNFALTSDQKEDRWVATPEEFFI